MPFILSIAGLLVLLAGVLFFNPATGWNRQRLILVLGILLIGTGMVLGRCCKRHGCGKGRCGSKTECASKCEKGDSACMDKCKGGDGHGDKKCCKDGEGKCDHHSGNAAADQGAGAAEAVKVTLPKTSFSLEDNAVYPFTVEPAGAQIGGKGVVVQDGKFFFKPSALSSSDIGDKLSITVDGKATTLAVSIRP